MRVVGRILFSFSLLAVSRGPPYRCQLEYTQMASPCGLSASENGGGGRRTVREREGKREREPNRSHIAFYDLGSHAASPLPHSVGQGNYKGLPRKATETKGMSRSYSDIKTEVHQAHIVRIPCGKWYFCDGHIIEATLLWPSLENKICHVNFF